MSMDNKAFFSVQVIKILCILFNVFEDKLIKKTPSLCHRLINTVFLEIVRNEQWVIISLPVTFLVLFFCIQCLQLVMYIVYSICIVSICTVFSHVYVQIVYIVIV